MEGSSEVQALIEKLNKNINVTPEVIAKGIELWLQSAHKKEDITELRNIRDINFNQGINESIIPISFVADRLDNLTGKVGSVLVKIPKAQVTAVHNSKYSFTFHVTALMSRSTSCTEPDTYAEIIPLDTPWNENFIEF